MNRDVIVIGGGASGLMAAITVARQGSSVLVLEHMDRVGKKILSTGNGKCNLTNIVQTTDKYRSDNEGFAFDIIKSFNVDRTLEFWRELGVYIKDKAGYIYPNSGQASSVLDVMRFELRKLGIDVLCNAEVLGVHKSKDLFKVLVKCNDENREYTSNKVILATGSKAAPKTGSDGSGYNIARSLGHSIVDVVPALTGLKCNTHKVNFKAVAGVRVDASVTLFIDGKEIACDKGELQITDYGVSGIPVFQISRYASKALHNKKKAYILIDFLCQVCKEEVFKELKARMVMWKTIGESLVGMFNKKLIGIILKAAGLLENETVEGVSDSQVWELVKSVKEFRVDVTGTNSFSEAQVCAGGVDTREVDECTLESKKVRGLYFAGEILDVDGECGGYNLQWAWSSGYVAGKNAGG